MDKSLDLVQKLCKQVLSIPGARVTFQRRTKAHHPRTQQLSVQNVAAVLIQDTCALQKTLSVTSATSKVTTVHSAFRSQSERSAIRQSPWTTSFAFLNTIGSDWDTFWTCIISVRGQDIPFKVNTRAEVTVVSEKYAKMLSPDMKPLSKRLHGPHRQPLSVLGEIQATLTYKGKQATQIIFVVHDLQHNLVGFPAIRAPDIPTRINAISTPINEQLPSLFTGLGTFPGSSFDIQLKADAKPFALLTPWNVSLPLRQKVKQEQAHSDVGIGSHRPNRGANPLAGMVVVSKKSNQAHICVDYRALNESVLREVHPLPSVRHPGPNGRSYCF